MSEEELGRQICVLNAVRGPHLLYFKDNPTGLGFLAYLIIIHLTYTKPCRALKVRQTIGAGEILTMLEKRGWGNVRNTKKFYASIH